MKVNFISRLNTRLFVVPAIFILLAYFGFGIWFYFSGATYVLKDFHAAQLITMLSDKKNTVELWLEVRRRALEDIAKNSTVVDSLQKMVRAREALANKEIAEKDQKKAEDSIAEAGQKLARYLEDFSQFRSVSFLSADGNVLWSTNAELNGKEWPDKDVFVKGLGRSEVIAAKVSPSAKADGLLFSVPFVIRDESEKQFLIVAQPNPADLAASLKVEKGFYVTGKVSIIDNSGRVVASKDMTDVGKVHYNVGRSSPEGVDYKDGLFYTVSPLKGDQLRLIATLDSAEAAKPLKPLMTVYLAFAGVIIAVILLQSLLIAPQLIDRPVARLLKATQSVAEGDLRAINLRKGYAGELRSLAEGFSQLIVALGKRTHSEDRPRESESVAPKAAQADTAPAEVRVEVPDEIGLRIRALADSFGAVRDRSSFESGLINAISSAAEMKMLGVTFEDLKVLQTPKGSSSDDKETPFNICEMLKDIEDEGRGFAAGKEIELVVECSEASSETKSDKEAIRRLCSALLRNAIRHTEVGTVTLLATPANRDGAECIEISVSDTGRGFDASEIKSIFDDAGYGSPYLDLCIARNLAGMLGGRLFIESMPGMGSLVTAIVPVTRGQVQPAAETV